MSSQRHQPDFRADFARKVSAFMDEHSCSTIELSREAGVRRETIVDAAENRRDVRPSTIERIASAMEVIKSRRIRVATGQAPVVQSGCVVTESHPHYEELLRMLQQGTIVMVGRGTIKVFLVQLHK